MKGKGKYKLLSKTDNVLNNTRSHVVVPKQIIATAGFDPKTEHLHTRRANNKPPSHHYEEY